MFRKKKKEEPVKEDEPTETEVLVAGTEKKGKIPKLTEEDKILLERIEYFQNKYSSAFGSEIFTQEKGVFEAVTCNLLLGILTEQREIKELIKQSLEE